MAKNKENTQKFINLEETVSFLQKRFLAPEESVLMAGNDDVAMRDELDVAASSEDVICNKLKSWTGEFPEKVIEYQKLQRLRQGRFPYWSHCPSCVWGKSHVPARRRSAPPKDNEVQIDQFWCKSIRMIVVVHMKSFCVGCANTCAGGNRATTVAGLVKFFGSLGAERCQDRS